MEEEELIKYFEANGMSYQLGNIIDAEGNWVGSHTAENGEVITSEWTKEEWDGLITQNRVAEEETEKRRLAYNAQQEELANFQENPSTTPLSKEAKELYPEEVARKEEEGEDVDDYMDGENYEKALEEQEFDSKLEGGSVTTEDESLMGLRALQAEGWSMINDDLINETKRVNNEIKEIEKNDPSKFKTWEKYDAEREKAMEESWLEKLNISNYIEGAVGSIFKAGTELFVGESAGMKGTEEEKQKYEDLLEKRRELQKPAATIVKDKLEAQIKVLDEKYDQYSTLEQFGTDVDLINYARAKANKEKDRLQSFIDGDNFVNIFNQDTIQDFASAGTIDLMSTYAHVKPLLEKIEAGEKLTENEQLAAEAFGTITMGNTLKVDQSHLYELTAGTVDSMGFLVGGAVGRLATRGASRAVTKGAMSGLMKKGLSKKFAYYTAKGLGEGLSQVGQMVLHGDSHSRAINKYHGDIRFETNEEGKLEITTDRKTYSTRKKELENNLQEMNDLLATTKDPDLRRNLQNAIKNNKAEQDAMVEPAGYFDAYAYGMTETLKENMIEAYGGAAASKLTKYGLGKIATKPWAKKVANSGVATAFKKANNMFGDAKATFNTLTGNKGSKLVGNNLEEMAEEVATQLVPVWGETDAEAQQRIGELFEGHFYAQVAGQTLLMGGAMKVIQSPQAGWRYLQKQGKLSDKRKAYKKMMKEFKKENLTSEQVEQLYMGAGIAPTSIQEYNNKVYELKKEGKFSEATELERSRTYQMGHHLVSIGRGESYVSDMNALIAKGQIPAESVPAIQQTLTEIKSLNQEMKKHKDLPNRDLVLNLKSKERYTKRQLAGLEREKTRVLGQEQSELRDKQVADLNLVIKNNETVLKELETEIEKETSDERISFLQSEISLTREIMKEYKNAQKVDPGNVNNFRDAVAYVDKKTGGFHDGKLIKDGMFAAAEKRAESALYKDILLEAQMAQLNAAVPVTDSKEQGTLSYEDYSELKTYEERDEYFKTTNEAFFKVAGKSETKEYESLNEVFFEAIQKVEQVEGTPSPELLAEKKQAEKALFDYRQKVIEDAQKKEAIEKQEALDSQKEKEGLTPSKNSNSEYKDVERTWEEATYQNIQPGTVIEHFQDVEENEETGQLNYKNPVVKTIKSVEKEGVQFEEGGGFLVIPENTFVLTQSNDQTQKNANQEVVDNFTPLADTAGDPDSQVEGDPTINEVPSNLSDPTVADNQTLSNPEYGQEPALQDVDKANAEAQQKLTEDQESYNSHIEDLGNLVEAVTDSLSEAVDDTYEDFEAGMEVIQDNSDTSKDDVNIFEDLMPATEPDSNEPLQKLAESMRKRAAFMEKRDGKKPTFRDYIEDLVDNGSIEMHDNMREYLFSLAFVWNTARLGKTDWKSIYNDLFNNINHHLNFDNRVLQEEERTEIVEPPKELKEKIKEETKLVNAQSSVSPVIFNPHTGEPEHVTQNENKVYGTENKINFAPIEFEEVIYEDKNGKKFYKKVNADKPKLNENSAVAFKRLVHPNKNNEGTVLEMKVLEGQELMDTKIPVRDGFGRQVGSIPFSEWIDKNQTPEMKDLQKQIENAPTEEIRNQLLSQYDALYDEFTDSDAYVNTVPMVYADSQGSVAYVPEVAWFTPLTVGDRTEDVAEVDLENPSEALKKDIKDNQNQMSELRRMILSGQVTEGEIVDKRSMPVFQKIKEFDAQGNEIPGEKLADVAPNSKLIVLKNTGSFETVDGETISPDDILNIGDSDTGLMQITYVDVMRGGRVRKDPKYANRGRTFYLTPHTTVMEKGKPVTKYIALDVLMKDENNNKNVMGEDLETARWIAAAHRQLAFPGSNPIHNSNGAHPYYLTLEQAQAIREQVLAATGNRADIKNLDTASQQIESLLAFRTPAGGKESNGKKLISLLLESNKGKPKHSQAQFQQHTKLQLTGASNSSQEVKGRFVPLTIKREINEDQTPFFNVAPVKNKKGETASYTEFLQDRLTTNVMGYNVGTEQNPVHTISVQQKIKVKPIIKEVQDLPKRIEEQKETKEVKEKITAVEEADVEEKGEAITISFEGKEVSVNFETGVILNVTDNKEVPGGVNSVLGREIAKLAKEQGAQEQTSEREVIYLYHASQNKKNPLSSFNENQPMFTTKDNVGDEYKDYGPVFKYELSKEAKIAELEDYEGKYGVNLERHEEASNGMHPYPIDSELVENLKKEGVDVIIDDWGSYVVLNQNVIKDAQQSNTEVDPALIEARKKAIEDATALAKELNLDIRPLEQTDELIAPEMSTVEEVENSISTIEGVTSRQEETVIDWIFSKLSNLNLTKSDAKFEVSKELNLRLEKVNNSLSQLSDFTTNAEVGHLFDAIEQAKNQLENILENLDTISAEAENRAYTTSFITDQTEETSEFEENVKNDFGKASNETKPIDKVGTALKRVFAQVGDGKTGFMGLETFASFKQMYDTVTLLLGSDVQVEPDFNRMMHILEKSKDSTPWMKPLIEKLKNSDEQVKNQFVYNSYRQKVNAKWAALSVKGGRMENQVFSSNANEASMAIENKWRENFKRGPLNNNGVVNKKVASDIVEEWYDWIEDGGLANQTNETYRNWLSKFGIEVSDAVIEAMRRSELNISEGGSKQKRAEFSTLFAGVDFDPTKPNRTGRLFSSLVKYASLVEESNEDTEFYENVKNHPFSDMNSIMSNLTELENKYNPVYGSTSRYVAGKSLTELEAFSYFYQQHRNLKKSALSDDKNLLNKLKNLSFSKDSYLLNLLMTDNVFARQFDHSLVDLMALKDLFKNNDMPPAIDDLSSFDYMFTQRTMFQDRKQGPERGVEGLPFKIRMAQMGTLTNSDKGRMMMLKTAVMDLYKESGTAFDISPEGEVTFTENLRDVLYSQLILPELRRMVAFIVNESSTNIKNYDKGATRFNLLPGLNTLTNGEGKTISNFVKAMAANIEVDPTLPATDLAKAKENAIESILSNVKESFDKEGSEGISTYLQNNILSEARGNVKKLEGFLVEKGAKTSSAALTEEEFFNSQSFGGPKKLEDKFNNADYLAQRQGSPQENMLVAELDFIINSMMSNMSYMQLMAGDPALYYKSKLNAESTNVQEQTKISEQLAINLGKRMAAMIAPGSILSGSTKPGDSTYTQVFLEDINGPAENLEHIIGWHYSKKELKETLKFDKNGPLQGESVSYLNMVQQLKEGKISKDVKKAYIGALEKRFDRIAEFIDIESTDAQEYTTLKEHLYVMEKQGRLSKKQIEKINEKVEKGEDLTKEELSLVLQPIKPVYTGTMIDETQDVNRMIYIKSSSFPLIPQLTKNLEIDKLRSNMEAYEKENNTRVRASYQTANKVGALSSENTIKSFSQTIAKNNTLTLDRVNFKIQQDVPFKSDKEQDDTVSMGTQIFKLLMGDGMMDLDGFEFEGQSYNGKDLKEEFHQIFKDMLDIKKDKFLDKLGLKEDLTPINEAKTLEKIQKLLLAEAKSRGFAKQDLKILSLVDDLFNKGKKTFKLPLWLTGNSNKYESMLNALINNKIFKQKIPGNKFVTGSEAGFKVQENLEGVDESRIVRIGDYKGGTLRSTEQQDGGGLSKAEVLMPSKFKYAGKLIDIFEDFNGTEGTYLTKKDGVITLRENMIDKKLLEQFVFRIPTSSHGLGSSITIAGFLPPENGDLIITPKSFVAQMGQDFDIDSLTAYQYNHVRMADGEIKVLNESNKEAFIEQEERKINSLEKLLKDGDIEAFNNLIQSLPEQDVMYGTQMMPGISVQEMLEELEESKKNIGKDFKLKILENKFIGIHNSVYSNPKAQNKINKVLSMAFAEKQADDIEGLTQESENSFNILSPKYQMEKMNAGSTGQDAIGIYAKGVTMHSLLQQAKAEGKEVALGSKEGGKNTIVIGNLKSTGELGNTDTISSGKGVLAKLGRRISTVLDERTNTGTDNEKAQILGRTGLNHKSAIAVDNLLTLLGFDAEYVALDEPFNKDKPFHRSTIIDGQPVEYKEYSVPYLLHSQPIIKELFSLINKKESVVTEPSFQAKQEAIQELLEKYAKEAGIQNPGIDSKKGVFGEKVVGEDTKVEIVSTQDNTNFTAETLASNIKAGKDASKRQQLEILALYVNLMNQAENVKALGQHVDLNNLGKSMWESTTKAAEFREFFTGEDTSGIIGAENLVGTLRGGSNNGIGVGEIDLKGNVAITPTTNQGVMVGTALSLSESLFTGLFPAKNAYINQIMSSILGNSRINEKNTFQAIKAKEKVFSEIKKYITSFQDLGLFNQSATETRRMLTIKTATNTPLSEYAGNLFTIKNPGVHKDGIDKVRNNLFLNLLKFNVGENGAPSRITFNNQESFDANQEAIYTAFKQLIVEDYPLPDKNGEFFSTRMLAQELIAYSFVSGGISDGALGFHKFIPVEYLDDMTTITAKGSKVSTSDRLRYFAQFNTRGKVDILGKFEKQYFQNNPNDAPQREMKTVLLAEGTEVFVPKEETESKYVAVKVRTRSKLKQDKWKLYERVPKQNFYQEIPVLGDSTFSEYTYGEDNAQSVVSDKNTPAPIKKDEVTLEMSLINSERLGKVPAPGSKVKDFLDAIQKGEYGQYENIKEMSKYLKSFLKGDEKFDYNLEMSSKGKVTTDRDGKVSSFAINPSKVQTREELAYTFVHETIHMMTSPYINQFLDRRGNLAKEGVPSELTELNDIMIAYKAHLIESDVYGADYAKFTKKYNKFLKDRAEGVKTTVQFTPIEINLFYASVNLKEFLATNLGNNRELKSVLKNIPYLSPKKSILTKFGEAIANLVKKIAKTEGIKENSAALKAIEASFKVIESVKKPSLPGNNSSVDFLLDSKTMQELLNEHMKDAPKEGPGFYEEQKRQEQSDDVISTERVKQVAIPAMRMRKNKCK